LGSAKICKPELKTDSSSDIGGAGRFGWRCHDREDGRIGSFGHYPDLEFDYADLVLSAAVVVPSREDFLAH
jgi:hypothetical protein